MLVLEQAPIPHPAPHEVRIAVHAAAITFAEFDWDLSWTHVDGTDRTPVIPSHELSGVVVEIGSDVTEVHVGEEVLGLVPFDRDGAAAEYVVMPSAQLVVKPANLTHVEAAALPLVGLTAWQALVDHGHVRPGEVVLVHGGAGGVGSIAIQIAKSLGAIVTTTARGRDLPFVRENGADHAIDINTTEFEDDISDVDVVIDTVGGPIIDRSFRVMRPGGRLVTLSAPPPLGVAEAAGMSAAFFVVEPNGNELAALVQLVETGRIRPIVSRTFSLADGRAAYESGASPRPPGKTVLIVRP